MRWILAGTVLAVLSAGSHAAEIAAYPINDGVVITISGDLVVTDVQKFTDTIAPYTKGIVVFSSDGGSLAAGLRIGTIIRMRNFATAVEDGSSCVSACALAWLGGSRRLMGANAKIGFHAAYYLTEDGQPMETGPGNALVGAYLNRLGLPDRAIIYITQADPRRITWLTLEDARFQGIDVAVLPPSTPNAGVATVGHELQSYRSELFGKLSQLLADEPGIGMVADRFVIPSDDLFSTGNADLTPNGVMQISKLADIVRQVAAEIPPQISWVLDVEGYTDKQSTTGGQFASNWELSAARAISVVKLLIGEGVLPEHVSATAYSDNHPLDAGDTPEAYAENRRIELRLTDRHQKEHELQSYRSELFGKLSQLLADEPGIGMVADRFVIPSDDLFSTGNADLTPNGVMQISKLADIVRQVAAEIPPQISWVLDVEGYTDKQSTTGGQFASNWELSAARAISAVKLLIGEGVLPEHVSATAYSDNHPLDAGDTPEAYAKNRRIELRLTTRYQ